MTTAQGASPLDAAALAEMVRKGDAEPEDLVRRAVERIEALNPQVNAVVAPLYERAIDRARSGRVKGPLAGVPFLVKDLAAEVEGTPLMEGSAYLRGYVSDHDSELVRRLEEAGALILGKTNTAEFGLLPTTEPVACGPTRNPWDPSRTPGGSSGGSAAAVACGMVPAAHGNDGGGSLRIPASCCGLFGLKPTRGRNPHGPDYGDLLGGLAVEHAVTRSVRDSALLLDVTAGPSPGDPYCAPPKERPYLEETERGPGTLRIGFTARAPFDFPVHPDCRAAVEDAAGLLAEMGHRVEEARPDYDDGELGRAFSVLWSAGCGWAVEYWRRAAAKPAPAAEHFEPFTWAMYKRGLSRTAPEYMLALTAVQRQSRRIAEFFDRFDLLLTPTLAEPPLPLGSLDPAPNDPMAGAHRAAGWACFTSLANAAGIPAMSAPLYWTASGLPVGVQFAAPFGGEDRLFRLAARLEEARPWRGRRPPVFAD